MTGRGTVAGSVWMARGLGLLALAGILAVALSDNFSRPEFLGHQDKYEHVLAFGVLGFLFGWRASLVALVASVLALTGVAVSIEFLQKLLTTTREAHLDDALASIGGLAFGVAIAWFMGLLIGRPLAEMRPS